MQSGVWWGKEDGGEGEEGGGEGGMEPDAANQWFH